MIPRPRVPGTSRSAPVVVLAGVIGLGGVLTSVGTAQTSKSPPPAQSAAPSSAQKPGSPPAQGQASGQSQPAAKIPADQLDALVAPIALYPDPLLAQTLAASTYPLEI